MNSPILSVQKIFVGTSRRLLLKGVSFDLFQNEVFCLVGESGSGKSLALHSILGVFPSPSLKILSGSIDVRVSSIGFVPQCPESNMNPVLSIGRQLTDAKRVHSMTSREAREKALFLLHKVGFSHPEQILHSRPHQLSGGMQQRVLIASALMNSPPLLLLDESTTALDATLQSEVLHLLISLKKELSFSMLFVTHDLGVVSRIADQVLVMREGEMIESGPAEELLVQPTHAYTKTLLHAVPA